MNRNNPPERIDPIDLISEHYEEIEMSDALRLDMQNRTRAVVGARRKMPAIRWAAGLAGVAAVIAVVALCWHSASVPPDGALKTAGVPAKSHHASVRSRCFDGAQHAQVVPRSRCFDGAQHAQVVRRSRCFDGAQHAQVVPRSRCFDGAQHAQVVRRSRCFGGAQHAQVVPTLPEHKAGLRLGAPIVVVVSVQQPVKNGSGKALVVGDRVASGDTVRTGNGGRVALVTRKGSELNLGSDSELALTAGNVATIIRGRLYCSNRDKEIARIETPAGRVKLLGTVVDTNVVRNDTVAVTVVEGRVQLSNQHGNALVGAGKRSVLVAARSPEAGVTVDTYRETSWYHGRGDYQSDFGDIAYAVSGQKPLDLMTEIWTASADGTDRHRVRTLIGDVYEPGPWVPGERWLSLDLRSPLWTAPDAKTRSAAVTKSDQPRRNLLDERIVLMDAATGQTTPLELPEGHRVLRRSFGPNAALMAFEGWYAPDPNDRSKDEYGVWIFDGRSGKVDHVYNGSVGCVPAWAPDGRHIAISPGEFATNDLELMIVDTKTRQVRDLGVKGAGASFSPDGRKIAYCGEFGETNCWSRGVPDSGSICVLDLVTPGAKPVRVSVGDEGALEPRWSPDGSRIAYIVPGAVWVVGADGTDPKEIYHVKLGMITKASWNATGDTVFVTENMFTLLLVAADGSGVRRTISQMGGERELAPDAKLQTDAAAAAIKDAVFEYAMGETLSFEGDLTAAQHYAAAAETFAGLVWNYPLSGLALDDTFRYADVARKAASRTDAEALLDTCRDRLRLLSGLIVRVAAEGRQFPVDLQSCLASAHLSLGVSLVSQDTAHVMLLRNCPGDVLHAATPYLYTPPAVGIEPKIGDVIVRCPLHPNECVKWDKNMARWLKEQAADRSKPSGK